ncbi:MAPEG family protein [Alteromonas sp. C1M14]|uniref:MAPEG family protein n=1 Tax=Alteromonas sp. C1M14 TaxID=2841567 RepID=UPI001C093B93|nr:MAPEG family protein [Alteromonas sp. C1M14]MBU2976671.1 MAPEG family protein [Alteromonas sp. C1M14]
MLTSYYLAISGLWVVSLTIFIQGLIAAIAHARMPAAVPGKMADDLGHESFVFRSHRTFHNSLENALVFIVPAILAMFISVSPTVLACIVWIYAIARIVHMLLYYILSTDKNPSPRSYFYLLGALTNMLLFIVLGISLV